MDVTWEEFGLGAAGAAVSGGAGCRAGTARSGLVVGRRTASCCRHRVDACARARGCGPRRAALTRPPGDASRAHPPPLRPCPRRGRVRGAEVYGAVGLDAALLARAAGRAARGRGAPRPGPRRRRAEAADALVRARTTRVRRVDPRPGRRPSGAAGERGPRPHRPRPGGPGARAGGPEVVFCGDLVEESGEPQAGPDAVPSRWPAALDRLLELGGEDAVYVPGHGAVVDAAFVRAQRDALARARFGVSGAERPCRLRRRGFAYRHAECASTTPDLTPPWKKPQPVPEVPAEPGSGGGGGRHRLLRRGDPLREDGAGPTVTLEDRFGKHRVFPLEPRGFLLEGRVVTLVRPRVRRLPYAPPARPPARSPSPARGPGWPAPGASTSRAGTTRSWSSGSGATTCASRAWSWSTWRASTTCPPIVARLRPGPGRPARRPGRPPGARLQGVPDRGSRSPSEHVLVVGHPYIDVWEAVKPSSVGIAAWPRGAARPGLEDGRVPGAGLAGEHGGGLAAHPVHGPLLQGPGAGAAGPGGGADRLRHGPAARPDRLVARTRGIRTAEPRSGHLGRAGGRLSPPGPAPPRRPAAARAG